MAQTPTNAINLDIAPDQFDKFMAAAKETLQRRRRIPDVASSISRRRRATDHVKKYQAATNDIVITRPLSEAEKIL